MEGPKTTGKSGPGQRHCRHSHGKHGHTETLPVPPNSTQEETVDDNPSVEITVVDARPVISSSDRKVASPSPRPASRRYDTRPSSTRSAFEHIPGTRPASRRDAGSCDHSSAVPSKETTISRSSNRSRKSRPTSTGSGAFNRGQSSDSDSDDDHKATPTDTEFHSVDILDEKAFDTDLEVEAVVAHPPHMADGVLDFQSLRLAYCEQVAILQQKSQGNDTTVAYDHSGKTGYIDTCKRLGVVPASYFLRHMNDRHLSMSHHGLGPSGMKALAEALAANTRVLKLDLSDNWLGKPGGVAVCEMLKENCFITDLNLSDNRLGNDCAPHLAQIMQQNVTLLHIILSGNEFDDNCAVQFAEAIMNTTKIQYLDLSHNHFGDVAGTILGPAIADNTCIKELNLSWNSIRRNGAVAITQGLKNNVYMKSINLSWNGFGLEGAIGLQDALKGNGVLEELDISNNRITAEGAVLIGKGLSSNETLKILKMGKNPMQSAGCFGICAAILRNPNCILESVDFTDILVNKDFEEVYQQVLEQLPNLKLRHGGMEPEQKPKAKVHPMVKLCNYIEKHELRLVDFFNKFDKDGSMSVTHEEFVEGIETARMALLKHAKETGIKLSEEEIEELLQELDRDGDGEINYNELVVSHVDFQEKREQINTVLTVMQPRPMTT